MAGSSPPAAVASSSLSHRLLLFLDDHFASPADLQKLPSLSARLDRECSDLEEELRSLIEDRLSSAASQWLSRSREARRILCQADDFVPSMPQASVRRILEADIPLLAKEVARIETIRQYAESSLQLEALVGDLEDSALAIVSKASQNNILSNLSRALTPTDLPDKQQKLLLAVKTLTSIENKMGNIASQRPQWTYLTKAVDSRVEKALAILRPQALTDHRAILASVGWPPPLSSSKLAKDKSIEPLNPLTLMQGEKKEIYSKSFLTLCALQQVLVRQDVRRSVVSEDHNGSANCTDFFRSSLGSALWTVDELAQPISSKMEHHFHKWLDQPQFIFALVYKITQDLMDGLDHVLQPLVDKAKLIGSSVREAWVTAMVKMLLNHLERENFPVLHRRYEARDGILVGTSWLHLVDLMVTFDKRMQILATSGMPHTGSLLEFEGISGSLSIFSIFEEHLDWLQIWAEIELEDANDKLKPELGEEKSWLVHTHQQALSSEEETKLFLLSNREDFRAPPIADSVVKCAWQMVERAVLLPTKPMKFSFIKSSVIIFLNNFFLALVQQCDSVELADTNVQDCSLTRLVASINVARYLESVLREWSEDVRLLEMNFAECNSKKQDQHSLGSLFKQEIISLVNIEAEFLEQIVCDILLQFDAFCWDYIEDIKQWGDEQHEQTDLVMDEQMPCVSSKFVEALDTLKDRLYVLRSKLNSIDFLELWRSIADGLDHFIFISIALGDVKFSSLRVNQYKSDMSALFLIFSTFCARPESFLPCIHDSLKLLTMNQKDAAYVLNALPEDEKEKEEFLHRRGLLHVTVHQAKKILKNRTFEV